MSTPELPRLLAVFLVVFDNLQGGKVAYEVPEGSVAGTYATTSLYDPSPLPAGPSLLSATAHAQGHGTSYGMRDSALSPVSEPLFELSNVLQYILPRRPVMRHLVTMCVDNCKILGFPVLVENQQYARGQFMYNVCFAFERNAELASYEPVVRKTGRVLQHMEETSFFLSNPENELRLHSILEQIYEDLGSYSEASIPLDEANTLDLKLFPQNPNPAVIRDWDIPVSLISLEDMKDESWDITMYSLVGLIDGTRTVKQIANMADVDLPLAREAMQHLLFYGCIILHDLFQFTNSYALVNGPSSLSTIVIDDPQSRAIQAECERYVCLTPSVVPFATLFRYYAKLRPALSLQDWIEKYNIDTDIIDVRRMISFGIIKGFLRRVQVFPVWLDHPGFQEAESALSATYLKHLAQQRGRDTNARPLSGCLGIESLSDSLDSLGTAKNLNLATASIANQVQARDTTPRPPIHTENTEAQLAIAEQIQKGGFPASLPALLDGEHGTDELCVRYRVNYRQLRKFLVKIGSEQAPQASQKKASREADTGVTASEHDLGRVMLIYV